MPETSFGMSVEEKAATGLPVAKAFNELAQHFERTGVPRDLIAHAMAAVLTSVNYSPIRFIELSAIGESVLSRERKNGSTASDKEEFIPK